VRRPGFGDSDKAIEVDIHVPRGDDGTRTAIRRDVGTAYKASNFKLHHQTEPDYWYVDGDGYVMHKKTLYNRATKLRMTENAFAEQYGYVKKFGGPKLCYVYVNTRKRRKRADL